MVAVFSIAAFFIVLREVLEACLVVGIVLAYLDKVGAQHLRKWVWFGAIAGIVCSIAAGLIFGIYFFVTDNQLFKDKAEKIFEGVAFLVAAGLLTWMLIWMMHMGKKLQSAMEDRVEGILQSDSTSARRKTSLFLMVFVQVLREGIETVIFLIGTASADDVGGWRAIPLPGVLAIIVGIAGSYLVFKGMLQLDIVRFFFLSGLVLMAFAAGLVSHAFHELQEVDAFGPWKPAEGEVRDWHNAPMWSTEGCCNDKTNEFFSMLRALFGYQDKPTFIEWVTYFAYWLLVIAVFFAINWKAVRAAKNKTADKTQALSLTSLLVAFVGFVYTLLNRTWIGILSMTLAFLLCTLGTLGAFDVTGKFVGSSRRTLMLGLGVGMTILTVFMGVMHIVELGCVGGEECGLDLFFYFGLIYDPDFLERGREENGWPQVAALSGSFVLTVFFFGAVAFGWILFGLNIDEDGAYWREGKALQEDEVVKDSEDMEGLENGKDMLDEEANEELIV